MARDLHKYRLRRPRELSGPALRGIASWPLLPTLVLTVGSGVAVILGAYWLIARFVPIGDQPMTAAQRLTAAFATATAAGALVALVVNVRKQDLSEQAARRDFESAFTERFRAAASQLGAVSPAERLAGVYAMASLADEYPRRRQQCVDVLCGYLRVPFDPAVDELAALTTDTTHSFADGKTVTSHATMAARPHDLQVRSTIISVIHARTQPEVETSWSHLNFDFTGARLNNLKFQGSIFSGDTSFSGATFSGEDTSFYRATFSGQRTSFDKATFSAEGTWFHGVTFSGEDTSFDGATFSGEDTSFNDATFFGVQVTFDAARKIGDAIVSGLEQPQLGNGATIKAHGRPFHGWPDPAVQTPAFPDGDTMD